MPVLYLGYAVATLVWLDAGCLCFYLWAILNHNHIVHLPVPKKNSAPTIESCVSREAARAEVSFLVFGLQSSLTVAPSMQTAVAFVKGRQMASAGRAAWGGDDCCNCKMQKKSWILGLRIPTASYICTGCPYTNNLNTYNLRTQNVGFCGNSSPFASHAIWVSRSWLSGALSPCWDGVCGMIWRGLFDAAFQGCWWSSYYATMLWCLMIFGYFELL